MSCISSGHRVLVAVGLVDLEHRELRAVRGVHALVAEDPADLEDPVDPADDGLLQVQLQRDAQHHLLVERVDVRAERPRLRAAVDQLQHRRLDLEVALVLERAADGAHDPGPGAHHVARLLAHDQVGVPLADAGLLGELLVQHRHRAQRLARHLPARRHHRELAALGGDHPALDEHVVAEVDGVLPVGQRLLADLGQAEHHLEPGADALLEGREAELAGVADEHHAAGDADDVLGLLTGLEVAPLLADLGQRVGAGHHHGVGLAALLEQPRPLLPADQHLVVQVEVRLVGGVSVTRQGYRRARRLRGRVLPSRASYPVRAWHGGGGRRGGATATDDNAVQVRAGAAHSRR